MQKPSTERVYRMSMASMIMAESVALRMSVAELLDGRDGVLQQRVFRSMGVASIAVDALGR